MKLKLQLAALFVAFFCMLSPSMQQSVARQGTTKTGIKVPTCDPNDPNCNLGNGCSGGPCRVR